MARLLMILQILLSLVVGPLLLPPTAPRPWRAPGAAARGERRDGACAPSALHPPDAAAQTRPCGPAALRRSSVRRRACVRSRPCSAGRTRSMCSSTAPPAWARPAPRGWRWRRPSARKARPFARDAPFVEMDATCLRFDERAIADPLFGSVHDPIYQGAGPLGQNGVPQPKEGAVTRAHGGVLFLDEIGEMHPVQMNKLPQGARRPPRALRQRLLRPRGRGDAGIYPRYIPQWSARRFSPHRRHHAEPRRHSPGPALALHGDILPSGWSGRNWRWWRRTPPVAPVTPSPGRMRASWPHTQTAPAQRSTSCSWRRPRRGRKSARASPARTWNTWPPARGARWRAMWSRCERARRGR